MQDVGSADVSDVVDTDIQDGETWVVLIVAVQFLPRALDSLSTFLRTFPVSRRGVQSLPTSVSGTDTRWRARRKRTTLRKHIFNSFLSLLHPPVHLRQLSAWQASRAWKNSLQTTGLRVRDGGFQRAGGGRTEPVGLLGMHW